MNYIEKQKINERADLITKSAFSIYNKKTVESEIRDKFLEKIKHFQFPDDMEEEYKFSFLYNELESIFLETLEENNKKNDNAFDNVFFLALKRQQNHKDISVTKEMPVTELKSLLTKEQELKNEIINQLLNEEKASDKYEAEEILTINLRDKLPNLLKTNDLVQKLLNPEYKIFELNNRFYIYIYSWSKYQANVEMEDYFDISEYEFITNKDIIEKLEEYTETFDRNVGTKFFFEITLKVYEWCNEALKVLKEIK